MGDLRGSTRIRCKWMFVRHKNGIGASKEIGLRDNGGKEVLVELYTFLIRPSLDSCIKCMRITPILSPYKTHVIPPDIR